MNLRDAASEAAPRAVSGLRRDIADYLADTASRRRARASDALRIDIGDGTVRAVAAGLVLGHAYLNRPDECAALGAAIKAQVPDSDASLYFALDLVFHLPLDLPRASPAVLKKVALIELERLNPVPPAALYIDVFVDPAREGPTAHVDVRTIRRGTVDEAVALCHAWGLSISAIQFEDDAREAPWHVFPVDRGALARRLWREFGAPALAVLAAILLLLLVLSLYLRVAAEADRMASDAEIADDRAALVTYLEHDIARMHTQYSFATAEKHAPMVTAVLAELSAVLPANSWLTQFDMKGTQVHIIGFSKSPSDVVAAIDRSAHFANAQFGAPLEGAENNAEHFDLTFDVRPLP